MGDVTEESPPERKAFWTNIVLVGGMIGVLLMPVFRSIYITETSPVGAWRGMTYFSIIFGIPLGILVALTVKETSKFQEIKDNRPTTRDRTKVLKNNLNIIFKSEKERRSAYIAILIISLIRAVVGVFISLGELYMANSPYLNEGDIKGEILLKVMNLDNLNSQLDPTPDGMFDFIEGITVYSNNGRIIFPVLEPFGSHLRSQINNNAIADKIVFEELYRETQNDAQQIAEKNKFLLKGSYKSSSSSEISLNALNVPQD